jgi:hypothetical protein
MFRFSVFKKVDLLACSSAKRNTSHGNFRWLFPALAIFMLWMKLRANNTFPFVSTTCRAKWVPSLRRFSGLTFGVQVRAVERESIERTISELLA